MRYLLYIAFLVVASGVQAQGFKPESVYASYFGETVTHPGVKVGVCYQLERWDKTKIKKDGSEKVLQKRIDISPGIGFFYHKDYQTGLFVLPELSYSRTNAKGNSLTAGVGAGYMRTFIPNVYDLDENGDIESVTAGYNYFLTNYSVAFGKDLGVKKGIPMCIFVKPQLMYALPNATKGILYFALELGASYRLIKAEARVSH
jgi:hypothetical protein